MHARPFDVALGQLRVQFQTFADIRYCILVITLEISKRTTHIVGKGFMFAEISELQCRVEGYRCFRVTSRCSHPQRNEALLQLSFSGIVWQLSSLFQTCGRRLWPESL